MVDGTVRGQHRGAPGCKGKAYQSGTCDGEGRSAIRADPHDAALAAEGSRNVQISLAIECQPLRSAQPTVKDGHSAVRIDLVHGIETRRRGSGDKKVPLRPNREVIGRHTRLDRREDKNLAVARNFKDGTAAVANIEILLAIEREPRRHSHAL